MQYERKLIQIFKSFIEKALVPQIKKMEGSLFQWNKFSQMVSQDIINYAQLQIYVDSLGSTQTIQPLNKRDQFSYLDKKKQYNVQNPNLSSDFGGFNPSKTFGGSRARITFPLKNQGEQVQGKKQYTPMNRQFLQGNRQDPKKQIINPQTLLPGLQRLAKYFMQNQQKMQSILDGHRNQGEKVSYY